MGKLKNRPPNKDRRPIATAVPQTILQRRAEIIYKMDHGFKAGDLANMYDLSESSIRRIYKDRHKTATALKTGEVSVRKRKKAVIKLEYPEVDEGVLKFSNGPVSGEYL
ncbi:hypothetical protein RvY_01941 [Ramazzottius varieornatus]|uniref:HTH psq-type domain-containing protein n=1 Tax=Ramazzottius varieornatus TaxID=947166 RepID=A0A1D1UI59_RAMVA|nr:hypothetical protein RvY_01941 [Ramazzottius varieornatus]